MSEFNWDAIITETEDGLCKWEDLSPAMQMMARYLYMPDHCLYVPGLTQYRTRDALVRRGLVEHGTDWQETNEYGMRIGHVYLELTGAGRRLVAKHLASLKVKAQS